MTWAATAIVGTSAAMGLITNRTQAGIAEGQTAGSIEATRIQQEGALERALIDAGVSRDVAAIQARTALQGANLQSSTAMQNALISAGVSERNATLQATTILQSAEMKAVGGAEGVREARAQFSNIQRILAPYISAGETSLTAQQALAGLGGEDIQREAIAKIEGGAEFQALTRQGEEAILQSASATGGLRGGNVQAALAQFRPNLLSKLIENQYTRLEGLTDVGQAATTTATGAGISTGANIASTLAQTGVPGVTQLPGAPPPPALVPFGGEGGNPFAVDVPDAPPPPPALATVVANFGVLG